MGQRREALQAHVAQLLREQRPDLLVLPETVVAFGLGLQDRWGAEPMNGPTVAMMAQLAVASQTSICVPIVEDDAGALYNSAIYVDRRGHVVGRYRKRVPTVGEIECGIRPGGADQQPVVLDGLRVGTAICFDENFPDLIWSWVASGIDLLVFPSYTYAGELMRGWAVNCGVPLVCAFPWESVIYDRDGAVLAIAGTETSTMRLGHHLPWIACSLNFRSRIYHLDFNQAKLKELAARYGGKVDIRLMVRDGRVMITAISDDVDINRLEREMGFVPLQKYLRDSRTRAEDGAEAH
jgi:predicted amidohydrolase